MSITPILKTMSLFMAITIFIIISSTENSSFIDHDFYLTDETSGFDWKDTITTVSLSNADLGLLSGF